MSVEKAWGHFFKPEVRSKGQQDFAKGLAIISIGGDAQIQGYVKGTPVSKVSFRSDDIASPTFSVDCSCSTAAKGNFCKHIWSVLLLTEKNHPDFLDSKTNIEKFTVVSKVESPFKAKQNEFKKQQYQKQKERAKEQRQEKKKQLAPKVRLPEDVEEALGYFSENGFPMENPIDEEFLKSAKKKLARIFHPDIGGSHQEVVILNKHYDVLISFLNS